MDFSERVNTPEGAHGVDTRNAEIILDLRTHSMDLSGCEKYDLVI